MENLEDNWVKRLCIVFKQTKQVYCFFLVVHTATLVASHCAAQRSSEPLPKPACSLQKKTVLSAEKSIFSPVLVIFPHLKMSTSSAQTVFVAAFAPVSLAAAVV